MSAPRVVLFDLLGTLVRDPFNEWMPAFFGMTLQELIAAKTPKAWPRFERGEIDEAEFLRTFFLDGRDFDHEQFKAGVLATWEWLPGMAELLDTLAERGVPQHGLSNYPVWWRDMDAKLGLSQRMDRIFVSCDLGVRKPHAGAYVAVLDELGLEAQNVLFVDDRADNVSAAQALGMQAVTFTDADALRTDLARLGVLLD